MIAKDKSHHPFPSPSESKNKSERVSQKGVTGRRDRVTMEKLSALGTAAGGARSYSDFMRSLAAKYNNNE